jgi:hypothetical protein
VGAEQRAGAQTEPCNGAAAAAAPPPGPGASPWSAPSAAAAARGVDVERMKRNRRRPRWLSVDLLGFSAPPSPPLVNERAPSLPNIRRI